MQLQESRVVEVEGPFQGHQPGGGQCAGGVGAPTAAETPERPSLRTSPGESAQRLGGGLNTSLVVTLADGQKGAFKPSTSRAPSPTTARAWS